MKKEINKDFSIPEINWEKSFQVPAGYFEDFPNRIQNRILETEKTVKKKNILFFPRYKIAVAAMLLVLLTIGIVKKDLLFNDYYSKEDISEIIENYSYDIDESLILAYIEEKTDLYSQEDESNNEMIDYLIDEGIEIDDLLNVIE